MSIIPTFYLKGTFNGWGLDSPFAKVEHRLFRIDLILSADCHRFKIADMDGTKNWTFSGDAINATQLVLNETLTLVQTQGIGNDLIFTPSQTGRFSLLLDLTKLEQPKLKLIKAQQSLATPRTLFTASLSPQVGCKPEIKPQPGLLAADELFAALSITNTETFPFVFGDSVDGYYEGKTHRFVDAGRYRHHQGWYLGGFASFVNNSLNDKTSALKAVLQAHGLEHHFANNSKDRLSLFSGKRMVCLSLETQSEKMLSLLPELNIGKNDCKLEVIEDTLLISLNPELCPEGAPKFIAISANQAFSVNEIADGAALPAMLHLTANNLQLMCKTLAASDSFTLYFSFEHDRAKALKKAQRAAKNHADIEHQAKLYHYLTQSYLWTSDLEYNRALMWSRIAIRSLVNKEFGTGIWAGLPWFKDCWGRDTFIALSGALLVNGLWQDAKAIITNFAAMQMQDKANVNYGRVPNRVTSKTNIIYNTTDGTPWMIREIMEYINYSGDLDFAQQIYPVVKRFIEGVTKNYLDSDSLMQHRDPDTWMDAKIDGEIPWSPRGPKANDIQALWFESLNVAARLAQWNNDEDFAERCNTLANKVQQSFVRKFWNDNKQVLADHLMANDKANNSVRPNQLMTLTIPTRPLLTKEIGQYVVKNAVDKLLFPWGICSLQQEDVDFHPYHSSCIKYHKDAAYHNGTIWGWNAGFTVSALVQYDQQELAYKLSKNLAKQILAQGHRGSMSENLDAFQHDEANLKETGTYSQAWSVSEFGRNAQQDYLGFVPLLTQNKIKLAPKLPAAWDDLVARLPFDNNVLHVGMHKQGEEISYSFFAEQPAPDITLQFKLTIQNNSFIFLQSLGKKQQISFNQRTGKFTYSDNNVWVCEKFKEQYPLLDELSFAKPDFSRKHAALEQNNYLLKKRQFERLAPALD